MVLQQQNEMDIKEWYTSFSQVWKQGEHVGIIGSTGTGKTTVAQVLLDTRTYVCVLAVKRKDETLERFKNGWKYGLSQYKVITQWPPDYPFHKVVLWIKPKDISDGKHQAERLYKALNTIYLDGGWCLYFDEAGFIAGSLGLGQALGVLLNQGRSAGISVVVTMTRPTSMIARVPKEALNQPRHKLIFKYENLDEIKACATICDIPWRDMLALQHLLEFHGNKRFSDFLCISNGTITLVRNLGDNA